MDKIKRIQFIEDNSYPLMMSGDLATYQKSVKNSRCFFDEYLKKLKASGFDMSKSPIKKRFMTFDGSVFPVTEFPNGIVIVDYPERSFK